MQRYRHALLSALCIVAVLVAGCGSPRKSSTVAGAPPYKGGGYYKDDGPGRNIPANIDKIPDAVPRIEPHNRANFRAYTVLGQRFVPVSAEHRLRQRGVASWYGRKFHGEKTANGETYDMYAMTAAHPTLPLPSYARVTHEKSGRSVIVRVNDRGPFLRSRVIDLSYAAAAKLGILSHGSDVVVVEAITHADIRSGLNMAAAPKAPTRTVAAAPAATPVAPVPRTSSTLGEAPGTTTTVAGGGAITPDALAVLSTQTLPASTQTPPAGTQGGPNHAEPRSPPPTVTEEASDGIYLQFGAFGSYIAADQLTNRLNREIGHVEALDAHIDTRNDLHRVRIGPYASRTAAVNAAVRIQEATGMQPMLAQR